MDIDEFRSLVWNFYRNHKRDMPWRRNPSPYWVFLSEVMLQQTQVERVQPKFEHFVKEIPDWETLAIVDTTRLLQLWSGLGYNTRAIRLRASANTIVNQYYSTLPDTIETLDALPGVGHATACAILAYAYNIPTVFIETNIRRVFIHHFFTGITGITGITDSALLPLVAEAVDQANPREWYWALMDYGSYLKKTVANPNQRSKHYMLQKKFVGSVRQMRGEILRRLTMGKPLDELTQDTRFFSAIEGLRKDGIIEEENALYKIK